MSVTLYWRPSCSSCKKAEADLKASGTDFSARDLFKEPLTTDEIAQILAVLGMKPAELLATRSVPYRDLGLAEREVDDDELIALMAQHPALLRRPIVIKGRSGMVGYNQQKMQEFIAA